MDPTQREAALREILCGTGGGWKEHSSPDGRVYYYSADAKLTVWSLEEAWKKETEQDRAEIEKLESTEKQLKGVLEVLHFRSNDTGNDDELLQKQIQSTGEQVKAMEEQERRDTEELKRLKAITKKKREEVATMDSHAEEVAVRQRQKAFDIAKLRYAEQGLQKSRVEHDSRRKEIDSLQEQIKVVKIDTKEQSIALEGLIKAEKELTEILKDAKVKRQKAQEDIMAFRTKANMLDAQTKNLSDEVRELEADLDARIH